MATKKKGGLTPLAAPPLETLIETAIQQIQQLGTLSENSPLFPNGLESVDVELDSGSGRRVSLKLKAKPTGSNGATLSAQADERVLLEGDVEATFNADGHHVIALIAQADLKHRFPNTMKKVQKIWDDGGRDLLAAATAHPLTSSIHSPG